MPLQGGANLDREEEAGKFLWTVWDSKGLKLRGAARMTSQIIS